MNDKIKTKLSLSQVELIDNNMSKFKNNRLKIKVKGDENLYAKAGDKQKWGNRF